MNATAPTRKLAAIMAADVVGYSRLMRGDETGTLAAMKALWSEVVQPSVRAHRGRVFKLMGDGMLAEFGSVVDAANAAEAMQTAANARAEDVAEDHRIQLRIGINLGDVVVDGSDLYGDGVNIAARLQEVAEAGGVAVSSGTYEYLRGKTAITFTDAGERSLKNIDQPVQVWLWPEPREPAIPARDTRRSNRPNIAVLPFQPLSPSPDAEFHQRAFQVWWPGGHRQRYHVHLQGQSDRRAADRR
jgi:adenylate cyclase